MKLLIVLLGLFFGLLQPMKAVGLDNGGQEELEGFLEAEEEASVAVQVPGVVLKNLVERGDTVKKGQVIALLMAGVEEAAVNLSKAQVEFGERKVERSVELWEKKLVSLHEKDEMETEVQISKLQLVEAQERLSQRSIQSPIEGVVVKRTAAPGEYVGEQVTLMTIVKIDPLNVEVVVPVSQYKAIRKGMMAEVRPEQPFGDVYKAKVAIVDPVVQPGSGTFGVRLKLPNPGNKIPAGLKCKVHFLDK